jgi:enoyl-CoA hydratase/carnithine racemase
VTLAGAVLASPVASVALAQVLRTGRRLDVAGALVVESLAYGALQAGAAHRRWLDERPDRPPRTEGDEPAVLVELHGDTLHLTLNRPWVRNAYNAAMRDDLVAALAVAVADPSIQIVLDGSGPSFCSGGDLAEFGTAQDVADAHVIRTTRSAGHLLAQLRERTCVRVRGACVGAGIELPAFAERIEAAPDSRFQLPEVSMGLIPGAGGTASIPRRIGPERTAWLGLTGQPLDAPTALRWGLVDEITEAAD